MTAAADQYSLATIAYFLPTRCLPYTAKAPREMFTQLLTMLSILLRMRERVRFAPEFDACARCPAAGARYPSVMAFANAFVEAASPRRISQRFSTSSGLLTHR